MAKDVRLNFGNIFEVKSKKGFRYFQLSGIDSTQLGGDVLTVYEDFHKRHLTIKDIGRLKVDFFTHISYIRLGYPKYWTRVGTLPRADITKAIFKGIDYDHEAMFREQTDGLSKHWCIWHPNEEPTYVGEHKNVPPEAQIGVLFNPESIYNKITTGKYGGATYFGLDE